MSRQNPTTKAVAKSTAIVDNEKKTDDHLAGSFQYSNANNVVGVTANSSSGNAETKAENTQQKRDYNKAHIVNEDQSHQTIDSGFISEPQSSFLGDEDDGAERSPEKKVKGENINSRPLSSSKNESSASDNRKNLEQELCASPLDSGCIDIDAEDAEAEAEAEVQAQNINMKLKHNVDAHISEMFCNLSLQDGTVNNLNAPNRRAATVNAAAATPATAAEKKPTNQLPLWEQYYQQNDDGETYLHLACLAGQNNVVAALIRIAVHPCLLNIKNDCGQTPLHLAALMKQVRILRMLLLCGAEPNLRDCYGNTALHVACSTGDDQCVNALLMPFSPSEISEAQCLQANFKINPKPTIKLEIRNYHGEFCVHIAAELGQIKILRLLAHYGADVNAKEGKGGYTALHIAIEKGHEELFKFLVEECRNKLNLEAKTFGRLTAYQFACILKRTPMKSALEKRGAEPLTPPDSDEYESSDEDEFE